MPFTLSFFLTLSAVMWFAYGLLLKDLCIAVSNFHALLQNDKISTYFSSAQLSHQLILCFLVNLQLPNILGFILGLLQMLLYGIYRNAQKVEEKKKLPAENLKSIVILSAVGGPEVYPVDAKPDVNGGAEEHDQTEESKEDEKSMEASQDKLQSNECAV